MLSPPHLPGSEVPLVVLVLHCLARHVVLLEVALLDFVNSARLPPLVALPSPWLLAVSDFPPTSLACSCVGPQSISHRKSFGRSNTPIGFFSVSCCALGFGV